MKIIQWFKVKHSFRKVNKWLQKANSCYLLVSFKPVKKLNNPVIEGESKYKGDFLKSFKLTVKDGQIIKDEKLNGTDQ